MRPNKVLLATGAVPLSRFEKISLRLRWLFTLLMGAIGIAAIVYLSINVARDLKLLNSASSDNVQWTLSQTEVEFVDFELYLATLSEIKPEDIQQLRRKYDIFYSRIRTLRQATIYEGLRKQYEFANSLFLVQSFLDQTVEIIDAPNAELIARLPELMERATSVRTSVRRLSNSGLNYFARDADMRRNNVSVTLVQMAIGVTALIFALILLSVYLNHLNRVNIRRRAEVTEASRRMQIVTSTALDAVIVTDSQGVVLMFNEAAEQIFGYTADEAIGNKLGTLIVPDHHRDAHEAGMYRMRLGGARKVVGKGLIQLDAKRKSGDLFPVEFAIQSAETKQGELFISFLRDISSRVEAERELVMARDRALAGEKAKTDFLATMSHEIRTPLNGLLGNLILLKDTNLSAKQSRYVKNMDTSGKLLLSHISDVLDITKYDAGKLVLRPVAMNISLLLQDIIDNQSGAASSKGTSLEWSWVGKPINWILADRERIQHILMNVIGNAVKFTRDGRVSVYAEIIPGDDDRPELQVMVADTGIGMTPELQAQIFDDFMTGDTSYDRDVGGTGLGLGIAKRFVSALGGEIDVESTVGEGSTFSIRFPITPIAEPDQSNKSRKAVNHARNRRILMVEDNEINRFVARELLAAGGHYVVEAHNGREGVEQAASEHFDLILMDISMPVLDGRGATREIRSGDGPNAQTPIVALTANAMAEEQKAFLEDGMNDVLTKPLSRDDLLRVISHYAEEKNMVKTTHTSATPAVATKYIDDLRDTLGIERLKPLLNRYASEVENAISSLTQDEQMTLPQIAELSHRIAGTSATLGATVMRAAFIDVENAAKASNAAEVQEHIQNLTPAWAKTRPLLIPEQDL